MVLTLIFLSWSLIISLTILGYESFYSIVSSLYLWSIILELNSGVKSFELNSGVKSKQLFSSSSVWLPPAP